MPTTSIDATYQGRVGSSTSGDISWVSDVRNATGTFANTYTSNTSQNSAIFAYFYDNKGTTLGGCSRTMLFFDVSSITTSNTISAATLRVLSVSSTTATDTIVVGSTAWGGNGTTTTLSTSDYSNVDHSTAYSSKRLSWSGGGLYNDYTLNAAAIADMNTNGYLNCAVIEGDYDYDNENPTLGTEDYAGVEFLDPTNKIKLDLTYATTPTSGLGEVNGVAYASIGNVNAVDKISIETVNGV